MVFAHLVLVLASYQTPHVMLSELRGALQASSWQRIEACFDSPVQATYLREMSDRRGGLKNLEVHGFPAPGGWEKLGRYWITFSTRQDIEDDHDPIYPVINTPEGLRLGSEIHEADSLSATIKESWSDVTIHPTKQMVEADIRLALDRRSIPEKALIFRLNKNHSVQQVTIGKLNYKDEELRNASSQSGITRIGGLLIVDLPKSPREISVRTSANLTSSSEDKVDHRSCYLTALWVPSLGRLPHVSNVRIDGPSDWVLRSEGELTRMRTGFPEKRVAGSRKLSTYRCSVPISFPKVIGGKYILAAQKSYKNKLFRSYQFAPVDVKRAEKDVKLMIESFDFFTDLLGPWPFSGYDCFDSDSYYGIESYSYTLLHRDYTSSHVGHEMGHTYFGGIVPCTYLVDTWNESLTQYVDSILRQKNADQSLQFALRGLSIPQALSSISVPHSDGSLTYYRGAYVMQMLENEVGLPVIKLALRKLVQERAGKDTHWKDLLPIFESCAGRKLDWFWNQWVNAKKFPTLSIQKAAPVMTGKKVVTEIQLRQSGTEKPFRLKFKLVLSRGEESYVEMVNITEAEETIRVMTNFQPDSVKLDIFGLSYIRVGAPVKIGN